MTKSKSGWGKTRCEFSRNPRHKNAVWALAMSFLPPFVTRDTPSPSAKDNLGKTSYKWQGLPRPATACSLEMSSWKVPEELSFPSENQDYVEILMRMKLSQAGIFFLMWFGFFLKLFLNKHILKDAPVFSHPIFPLFCCVTSGKQCSATTKSG